MSTLRQSDNATAGYCDVEGKVYEPETWRMLLGELAATALLLMLSCMPVCVAPGSPAPLLTRAFTSGLTIALLVQCFDHISGAHMNPAVTLAAMIYGRVSVARGTGLIAAQALGGIAGAAIVFVISDDGVARCATVPQDVAWRAAVTEAACTACLALFTLSSWDIRNHRWRDSWPLRVGFAITALTLISGDVSGASFNPLRSFATALLSANWNHQWTVDIFNQLKINREFFLSFDKDPRQLTQKSMLSQTRDLKTLISDGNLENERRVAFYA